MGRQLLAAAEPAARHVGRQRVDDALINGAVAGA
jgi:hypothetical protein